MRKIIGLLALLLGISFIYFLQNTWSINNAPIPAMGKLLNPFSGVWQNAENPNSYSNFNLKSEQLKDSVTIVFDERMVPHIYAQNLSDALFAQGYVEAYHRLFQMDISTRSTDGKLSEIFGNKLTEHDLKQRRLGLGFAADNAIKGWKKHPTELKKVESYVAGVNHYVDNLNPKYYPLEYKLLDSKPSNWSLRHCALLLKAMTQTLAGYEEDIEFSNALQLLGSDDFSRIYPERNAKDTPVIRRPYKNTNATNIAFEHRTPESYLPSIKRPRSPEGVGSNNWAIAGNRTTTGKPMLANDPHLALSLPSVWYEIAITTPDFSARGVTLLGMPGIMIGFNESIAWGETNVGHDVMDYHRIEWTDDTKTEYLVDSQILKVEYRVEDVAIKGKPNFIDSVKYTIWGPIVDDDKNLALRWLAHDEAPGLEFLTFVKGMTSNNYDEYLVNTSGFYTPAQNFIYADNKGEIGLRVNGNLPIRNVGQGRTITPGNTKAIAWNGFIDRAANPQERNPERGFVTSANQWSTSANYPYYYHGNFEAFRGRMTNRLLSKNESMSISDMQNIQMSNYSIEAEEALPILLSNLDSTNKAAAINIGLHNWDFSFNAKSESATFFDVWYANFRTLLWDEIFTHSDSISLPVPQSWVTIQLIEKNEESKFFDILSTPEVESLKDLCNQSFNQTLQSKNKLMAWGHSKEANIPHLIKIPALSHYFENGEVSGHKYAINAVQSNFGPSWRMIVALGDKPEAYGIFPGGQSGNPASYYYKNMIEEWAKGQYDKLVLSTSKEEILNPKFTIICTP